MFHSTQEFDSAMKELLTKLRDGEKLNSLIVDEDSAEAIVECVSRGFLQGVFYERNANGNPLIDSINPRITYAGLAFIESN